MVNYSLWKNDWIEVLAANRIVDTIMKMLWKRHPFGGGLEFHKTEQWCVANLMLHSVGSNILIEDGAHFDTYSSFVPFSVVHFWLYYFLLLLLLYHRPVITRDDVQWHTLIVVHYFQGPCYHSRQIWMQTKEERTVQKLFFFPNRIMLLLHVMCVLI